MSRDIWTEVDADTPISEQEAILRELIEKKKNSWRITKKIGFKASSFQDDFIDFCYDVCDYTCSGKAHIKSERYGRIYMAKTLAAQPKPQQRL